MSFYIDISNNITHFFTHNTPKDLFICVASNNDSIASNIFPVNSHRLALEDLFLAAGTTIATAIAALVFPLDVGKALVVLLQLVTALISWYLVLLFAEKGNL